MACGHNVSVDDAMSQRLAGIDPTVLGARLREARRALRLTQAAVGGEEVSIAYISRIETGDRRPTAHILEMMAERLGASLESLLAEEPWTPDDEFRLRVDYAELALESGEGAEALTQSEALLERAGTASGALVWRARFIHARALEMVGRRDEAINALEDVVAAVRDDSTWVTAAVALVRCYCEAHDYGRAITQGESVLEKVKELGMEGSDEQVQLAVTIAWAYHDRGDTGYAVRLCQRAIAKAEEAGSPVARGSAYWNASVFAAERGDFVTALPMAERALALFSEGRDARNLARLRSMNGVLLLRADPPDVKRAVEVLAQAAEELVSTSASTIDLARNNVSLARAYYLDGDFDRAEAMSEQAIDLAGDTAPGVTALGYAMRGQLCFDRGDVEQALAMYREAVQLLSGVGDDWTAAETWYELAEQLEQVGDKDAALDAYRRAAASTGLRSRPIRNASVRNG